MKRAPIDRIHVIVSTHTSRHLRHVLMGVRCQQRPADRVVVAVDNDKPEIADLVRACVDEFAMPITLTQRPFNGVGRVAQTRNNGIRALLSTGDIGDDDLIVLFDGDCTPMPDVLERYETLAEHGDLIIGWRVYLTEQQTEEFDEQAMCNGRPPAAIPQAMFEGLKRRHRRFLRCNFLRPFHLSKCNKPNVLGGNHAVRWPVYCAVNGYDEAFQGWGSEDDDLGRRIYRAGGKTVVAVRDVLAYHLYHPEQSKDNEPTKQAKQKLKGRFKVKAEFGIDNPFPQELPTVTIVEPSVVGAV